MLYNWTVFIVIRDFIYLTEMFFQPIIPVTVCSVACRV